MHTENSNNPLGASPRALTTLPKSDAETGKVSYNEHNNGEIDSGSKEVAVDEYCPLEGYSVYNDGKNLWDATLQLTSARKKANKFYVIQVSPFYSYASLPVPHRILGLASKQSRFCPMALAT